MTESASRPISDRWELTARIGSGAMGEVWRGRHRVLGHDVAVKVMKRDASRDQQLVARFLREARISAQLRHRNIARVEDFGTTPEGKPFLVMELLSGVTVEDLIERGARVERARVLTIARHVGAACDVAHAQGIVHRDLKPANCFLLRDEDGADLVKVLDFGVAKVSDGLLATQHAPGGFSLIGTPVYMSPEQARGDAEVDFRSDLWSLGAMLYELLTGALPFQGETLPHLLLEIQSARPLPPSGIDPTLSPSVDAWAARALAREPAQRFQSGRELAETLAIALAGSLEPPRPHIGPIAWAPTASLPATPPPPAPLVASAAAPVTLAPTQPMRAVDASLAPRPVALPPRESLASVAPPTRRGIFPLALLAGAALLGVGLAVAAVASRPPAPAPAPSNAPPETVVRPIPVVAPTAAPAPATAPVPAPLPAARPARTAQDVAPPSVAARPARAPAAPLPARRVEPEPAPAPLVNVPPPPQPAPTTHAPYNPDEP